MATSFFNPATIYAPRRRRPGLSGDEEDVSGFSAPQIFAPREFPPPMREENTESGLAVGQPMPPDFSEGDASIYAPRHPAYQQLEDVRGKLLESLTPQKVAVWKRILAGVAGGATGSPELAMAITGEAGRRRRVGELGTQASLLRQEIGDVEAEQYRRGTLEERIGARKEAAADRDLLREQNKGIAEAVAADRDLSREQTKALTEAGRTQQATQFAESEAGREEQRAETERAHRASEAERAITRMKESGTQGRAKQAAEARKGAAFRTVERDFLSKKARMEFSSEEEGQAWLADRKQEIQDQYEAELIAIGETPTAVGGQPATTAPQALPSHAPFAAPQQANDFGPAPPGKPEGTTGTHPDGTKVVVRNGRIVRQ